MQLNDMSKIPRVHEQEPVNRLCETLKFLAHEDHKAVQTNETTIAAGAATLQQRRHARPNKRSAHNNDYNINSNTATANSE
jgi:hypothetical protein